MAKQQSLFRWDMKGKRDEAHIRKFFEVELQWWCDECPTTMLRFHRILKEFNLLNCSSHTIEKHCKITGHFHTTDYVECYKNYRRALDVFDKISKTPKFRKSIIRNLDVNIKKWQKIKDAKELKCGWIEIPSKKPVFNSEYWAKNVKMLTLQDIVVASEFLGKDVPKEILDRI